MNDVWVLVAGSSEARVYSARHRRAPLELVTTLTHEVAHAHSRNHRGDEAGRVHDRFGSGRHSMDEGQQLKNEERLRFAREVTALLVDGHRRKRFSQLVVMAGPAFLGLLRECFSRPLAGTVIAEVAKDLLAQAEAVIQQHIP